MLVSIGPVSALEIDQISGYNNLDGIDLQSNIQYSLDGDMHNTLFNSANLSENEVYILNSMNPSSNVTKSVEGTDTSKKDIKKVVGFVILAIAVIFFITMLYTKSCTVAEKTKVEEENKKLDDQCPYDQRKVQANNYEQSVAEAKAKSAQAIQDFNSYVKEIKLCSRDDVSPAEMDHVAALEQRIAITRKAFMDAESLGPINNKAIIAYETNLNSISGFNLRIHDVNWRMGWSILGMLGGGGLIMDLDRYFFHD